MYVLTQSFPHFFDYFLIQPRRLVAVFLLRIRVFDPITVHLEFVVNRVAVGQVFLPVLRFSLVTVIPPVLRTRTDVYS
jgi:hypothetical protein